MKPTDEERREVAARLRDFESLREVFKESNICVFSNALGVGYMDWEHICARLADLIEPAPERTCRVLTEKRTVSQTQEMHIKSCSACGYMFGAEKHCQLLPGLDEEFVLDDVQIPGFCPNCGAKVIEEES